MTTDYKIYMIVTINHNKMNSSKKNPKFCQKKVIWAQSSLRFILH